MGCLQSGFNPQKYAVRDSGESFVSENGNAQNNDGDFERWEISKLNDKNTMNIYIETDGKLNNKGARINPNAFQFLKVLGKGAFGKVLLVEKRDTHQLFAMKVIRKDSLLRRNQRIHTREERRIMENLTCPFIVQLFYAFQTNEKLYMVMDFMVGGELFFHLRKEEKFSEQRVKFYAGEIVLALEYMHNKGIIYRDLKPENILMDAEGHLKIVDFGLSKQGVEGGLKTYTFCGTPEYLAPEILQGTGHDKAVDYWSLGAMIYEMLSGSPPFYDDDKQRMFRNMLEKPIELPADFSREAASLLTSLLTIAPSKRLSNPIDIKRHDFFRGLDWDKLATRQVKPPYVPKLKNDKDLRYFDRAFTGESIGETPVFKNEDTYSNDTFKGFTYDKDLKKAD